MKAVHDSLEPEFSVVIPAYNADTTLRPQLDALRGQKSAPAFEVVIADNGSSDGTVAVALSFADTLRIRVADASRVSGASHARNAGALVAKAPFLAFADADDIVDYHWLKTLAEAARRYPDAMLLGTLDYDRLNDRSVRDAYGYLGPTHDGREAPEHAVTPFAVDPVVDSLPGGNFAVPADAWRRLAGMREDFPYGSEDADLGIRAQRAGMTILRVPRAIIYCRLRETGLGMFTQQRAGSRSRAFLGTQHDDPRLGVPGAKSAAAKVVRSLLQDVPDAITRRDARRLLCNLGISVGRLEGALRVRRLTRSTSES